MNIEQTESDQPAQAESPTPSAELAQKARAALADFYGQLSLSQADQVELWVKRGLPAWECERAGYRTNHQANRDLLRQLARNYDEAALVESGLWVKPPQGGEAKPNSQFCGYGLIGKNNEREEWGWKEDGRCNPLLIPYFDSQGRLFHLRPHKGGTAGKPPHLYVARSQGAADAPCSTAVITEGEHKARALSAVLNAPGQEPFAVAALPGISMARNQTCLGELLGWLSALAAKRVIIAYDHEDQSDPRCPAFKTDKRKRHQAQIWARYLAQVLGREGYEAVVAVLPKAWQINGKADWDSRLAASIAQLKGELSGQSEIWTEAAPRIRAEWLAVLAEARKPNEFRGSGLFTDEEERLIHAGINRLYRRPRQSLAVGGGQELDTGLRLKRLARGKLHDVPGVYELGESYQQTLGVYYQFQAIKGPELAALLAKRAQAEREGDADLVWFCDVQKRGDIKRVSDFWMTCHYALVKEDGTCERIVTLENIDGEKAELAALPSRALTSLGDFREWLANTGGFTWLDGDRPLQKLQADLNREAAFMRVEEVSYFGHHPASGLWFFQDVAYGPEGDEILPDEYGIFWWGDRGYKLAREGADHQSFRQPLPQLKPSEGLVWDGAYQLVRGAADDPSALQGLFQEVAHCFRETLGGYEAYTALGAFLAFGAAPEVFNRHGAFPGLWVTGEKGSGKTTLCYLQMEFFGFGQMKSGIGLLRSSTPAGIQIAVEQFSNLPVWLDEYRETEVHPDKRAILHAAYNRELSSKYAERGRMRQIRSAFIISGESTTSDAATRSRYPHIHMDKNRRHADHMSWFEAHRDRFAAFGRFIMRNRRRFAQLCLERLSDWMKTPELAAVEARSRLVYGVPYAAFIAMAQLLQSPPATELEKFRQDLLTQVKAATEEVQSQTDVSMFFQDMHAAYTNGAFGKTASEFKHYFRAERKELPYPPGAPNQNQVIYVSYDLYFKPTPVLDVLRRYKRAQGQDLRLSQLDLRRQMATKEYWIAPKHGMHRKPFAGGNNEGCWGVSLYLHPNGYVAMDDAEWLEHLEKQGLPTANLLNIGEGSPDPRHGELYAIVYKLLAKE